MKTILFFVIFINPILNYSQTNISKSDIESEENELAAKICGASYLAWGSSGPILSIETVILHHLGVSTDDPKRSEIISTFFNENHLKLICNGASLRKHREYEHFFKRAIACQSYDYIYHIAGNEDYTIDLNAYEIIDGKKETILDYVEKILNTPKLKKQYDIESLIMLKETLEEVGVVRGKDLK